MIGMNRGSGLIEYLVFQKKEYFLVQQVHRWVFSTHAGYIECCREELYAVRY